MKAHIEWKCPICGFGGNIDPVNSIETVSQAISMTHAMLSPNCPSLTPEEKQKNGIAGPTLNISLMRTAG